MPGITPIGALDRNSPTFRADCNAYFAAKIPVFSVEMEAARVEVLAKEASATAAAVGVATNAANAAISAALAATYAGASQFVPTDARTTGDKRWSSINGFTYRARTTGAASATDPSNDSTNWELWSTDIPVQVVTGLNQQMVSGAVYSAANTTAQAAATNECLWSDDANNAVWAKTGYTVAQNVAMDPGGNILADKLVESATNVVHYEIQAVTRLTNVPLTFSRRYKADGRSIIWLLMDGLAWTDGARAMFDLATGVVSNVAGFGTGTGAAASMVPLGDGWWECRLSCTPTTAATSNFRIVTYISSLSAYLGDGVSGVLVSGGQIETGTTATSRILTTSVAVTRAAGLVAPTWFVLPPTPQQNAFGRVLPNNGITTNVVHPNGQTIEGQPGPINLDDGPLSFKFIGTTWRVYK